MARTLQYTSKDLSHISSPPFIMNCRNVGTLFWNDLTAPSEMEQLLNGQPALWVMGLSIIFFTIITWFMDSYVVTSGSCIALGVGGSYMVFASYYVLHYYLDLYSSSYRVMKRDKQFYVLSNLIKFGALMSYTPIALKCLYESVYLDEWPTQRIRNMGCMYSITDFVSIFLVKKMTWSTKLHHACVTAFAVVACYNDYSKVSVHRLMVVYAIFSTFSCIVNLLLASRYFSISNRVTFLLSCTAFGTYSACCIANWSFQFYYAHKLFLDLEDRSPLLVYAAVMVVVVYDDLQLLQWLAMNLFRQVEFKLRLVTEKRLMKENYKKQLNLEKFAHLRAGKGSPSS